MDAKKNILIITSYTLIVCLLFTAGYITGKNTGKKEDEVLPVVNTAAWVDDNEELPYYTLILKNSNLMLYKHYMGETELLYMKSILQDIFPKDDIKELTEGITFDKLEDAQSLLENFVS